jgi:protein CpxP
MKKITLMLCLFLGLTIVANAQTHPTNADPIKKAKELQQKLKLTDAQTTKIAAIYTDSEQKFEKIKVAEKGNNDKMLVAIRPLRQENIKKIKAVLTPAQAAKYEKMVNSKDKESLGWSDGWSANSN